MFSGQNLTRPESSLMRKLQGLKDNSKKERQVSCKVPVSYSWISTPGRHLIISLLFRGLLFFWYGLRNEERWKVSARSLERIATKAHGDTKKERLLRPSCRSPRSSIFHFSFLFCLFPPLMEPLRRRELSHGPSHRQALHILFPQKWTPFHRGPFFLGWLLVEELIVYPHTARTFTFPFRKLFLFVGCYF